MKRILTAFLAALLLVTGAPAADRKPLVSAGGIKTLPAGDNLLVLDGIQIGHASDTTLTRGSAGNLSVEGNPLYRSGGTDVAVADGGTGASTAAAARINLLPSVGGNALKVLRVNAGETDYELATISGGSLADGDYGDITVGGSGTTLTIDSSAVTLAKIANAAANNKLVGSGASGSGSAYVEITLGTNLSMSGTTLNAASVSTPSGTSFPGSPSDNDEFCRTDRHICYFYQASGTRWLSTQIFTAPLHYIATTAITATGDYLFPLQTDYDIYVDKLFITTKLTTGTTGTNYFTFQLKSNNNSSDTNLGSTTTNQNDAQNNWAPHTVSVAAVVDTDNTAKLVYMTATESGTASMLLTGFFTYRLVG